MTKEGKASTIKETFSRETSVGISISADPAIIWALLTNASDYHRWNSTVISIEGNIAPNEKINLKSKLDPKRSFKLVIKEFITGKKLVWGDSKGERVFQLESLSGNKVKFGMKEKIGGLMFPLYAKYIPPFDESFEQFAHDLKTEAEIIQSKGE